MTDTEILTEGRRRLRASAPWLTDAQFETWAAAARSRGASFELTPEGVVARSPIENAPVSEVRAALGCV